MSCLVCIAFHCFGLYCIVLYCIVLLGLYCIILICNVFVVLYCLVRYFIVLYLSFCVLLYNMYPIVLFLYTMYSRDTTRLGDDGILNVPPLSKSCADCYLQRPVVSTAPTEWNALSPDVRLNPTPWYY